MKRLSDMRVCLDFRLRGNDEIGVVHLHRDSDTVNEMCLHDAG